MKQFQFIDLRGRAGRAIAIISCAACLLWAAIWNGYPLLFFDSGAYIYTAFSDAYFPERSAVYPFFLFCSGAGITLWLPVVLQSLLMAYTLVQVVGVERPDTRVWQMAAIGFILSGVTVLPWIVGQIEPDCFTPMLVLSIYLLLFRWQRIAVMQRGALIGIAALATSVHLSHLGLAIGMIVVAGGARALLARFAVARGKGVSVTFLPAAFAVSFSLAMIVAANYAVARSLFVSRSGPVFLTARMIGDGTVKLLLDARCPDLKVRLCSYKNELPSNSDIFLWDSRIFPALGRFDGMRQEADIIVRESLRDYPLINARNAVTNTFTQLIMFRSGDGLVPHYALVQPVLKLYVPSDLKMFTGSRQQNTQLLFPILNAIHLPFAAFGLLGMILIIHVDALSRRTSEAMLPSMIIISLLGNAFICGALSGPHDRYNARLIWIPLFVLLIHWGRALALRPQRSTRASIARASSVEPLPHLANPA